MELNANISKKLIRNQHGCFCNRSQAAGFPVKHRKKKTSIIKREKPFDGFLLPDLHNAGTEEQTSRKFRSHSKLPAASQCSPTTLSSSWMGTEPLSKLLGAYKPL